MKFVKKFEHFGHQQQYDYGRFTNEPEEMPVNATSFDEPESLDEPISTYDSEETREEEEDCVPCSTDDDEEETREEETRTWNDESLLKIERISTFNDFMSEKKKQKEVSYEDSGLENPEKADLDGNKKISPYEKKRGKAIEDSIKDQKKGKGLTDAQKKLPEGLRKAIEAKNKKTK